MFTEAALEIIEKSIIPEGILASSAKIDNYNRIWARDSSMTGIAGVWQQDKVIAEGLKNSTLTLLKHQNHLGQIPSNVAIFEDKQTASFGSLVGRIDCNSWWIIASCIYLKFSKDEVLKKQFENPIKKAFFCLETWEYNSRGLLYGPLGGNWADEYVTSGYTLYDNVLRFWAFKIFAEVFQEEDYFAKAENLKKIIKSNFTKNSSEKTIHPNAVKNAESKPYFWAAFDPSGYNTSFDMAGNSLALLMGFYEETSDLENYLRELQKEFNSWALPVFYPIITEKDKYWDLLSNNYSYQFKNYPNHFHNGGSWPVFLGWMSLGLSRQNKDSEIVKNILEEYEKLLSKYPGKEFSEYYDTKEFKPLGTPDLCFSATGYLLMKMAKSNLKII
ncbi:glycoside hydrolase 100 family protein [Halpernia frigidisoli]|uniref:beta-fructofuranosidase n=1 Tax=Halpernia frigidisoli TaxID=1125876 RepID=A0A1I3H1Y7_9FLAO|nr:glycoside hydrolase 100 family protein [Halpernia frigidisoli]SFI29663.1 Alkaline and neutral invertase [Halpernia frigidisoli]